MEAKFAKEIKSESKGFSGYRCACGREHLFNMYAIAQMAMGHELTHACGCGRKNSAERGKVLLGIAPDASKG